MDQSRIAVFNQKGGVGKTTTAVSLAVALVQAGARVLLVDLDAQSNATQFLGINCGAATWGAFRLLTVPEEFCPQRSIALPGLDVVPGNFDDHSLNLELSKDARTGHSRLDAALSRHAVAYDYVIVDCAPTLSRTTLNALVAAPSVLVPIELAHAAAMAAVNLYGVLETFRITLQPRLHLLGVLGTFASQTERTPAQISKLLRTRFKHDMFETAIHTSAAIRDSAGQGRPIVLSHPKSRGSLEYQSLTQEVLHRVLHP